MAPTHPPGSNPAGPTPRHRVAEEKEKEKMEGLDPNLLLAQMDKGNGDDKTLWLFLLLLLYGKDGFGGKGADQYGAGVCCPPVTLEQMNDMQNAIQSGQVALSNRIGDQTSNIIRDIGNSSQSNADGFARICEATQSASNLNQIGQKDLTAAVAKCCCDNLLQQKETQGAINYQACETRNSIEKCCCETQNAIALQTNAITTAICNDGQATRALITDNRMQDLQSQLQIARDENSNLRQTEVLSSRIREACCQPCQPIHPHHGWHGGGGGNGNGGPPPVG